MLRGKFMAVSTYNKKDARFQIGNLTTYNKKTEKEHPPKKSNQTEGKIKTRVEIH